MLIFYIIGYLSTLSWLFLPITQRDSKYFYYFLLMAISGLYGSIVFTFHLGVPYKIILSTGVLLIPSVFRGFFTKYRVVLIIVGILVYLIFYDLDAVLVQWFRIILDTTVLLILSVQIGKDLLHTSKIRIVWIVLIIYQFSVVANYFVLLTEPDQNTGVILFYFTTIFQILVGIFFLFAREENPKLIVEIR